MTRRRVVVDGVVRAAGGVVIRPGDAGPEVLLVHRPRRSDWSFPKGHLEPGETDREAALREVEEETGLACQALHELGETRYEVDGSPKGVRYWLMSPSSGSSTEAKGDGDEVDDVRWLGIDAALGLLSHADDRALLAGAELARPVQSS